MKYDGIGIGKGRDRKGRDRNGIDGKGIGEEWDRDRDRIG